MVFMAGEKLKGDNVGTRCSFSLYNCMSGSEGSFGNFRKMGGCFSHQSTLYVVHIFRQRYFLLRFLIMLLSELLII
jgi:hypothetical protein